MNNNAKTIEDLQKIVGKDAVVTDAAVLARTAVDYVGYRNWERFNKQFLTPKSICIAKAQSTEQISKILSYLNTNKIIAIPFTGGSSATAGIEPINENTVVVDGSRMDKILKLDEENMMVTVQCGVPLETLENYLNGRGLSTGHFPQSLPMAQIGGLVATRSIGQFSTLYGGIEDMVVGLEAVLPNGEVVRIKNVPRRAAGPDIRHIFIGSEGALAYITEITLKLFAFTPDTRWERAYSVPNMTVGLKALRDVLATGCKPCVARLHDAYQAELDYGEFVKPGECIFICVVDGVKAISKAIGDVVDEIFCKYGATSLGEKPVKVWFEKRNKLCFELDDSPTLHKGIMADTCEISALWSDVGAIYDRAIERITAEIDELVYICGHSSHSYAQGTNIYFKFGIKASGMDGYTSRNAYIKLFTIIMEETLKKDGSIAHHHGIGKYRTPWVKQEHGSAYITMRTLKDAFDPNGIMNEGTLFPVE